MEHIIAAAKILFIFSPVILWGILIWRAERWDRRFRDMNPDELHQLDYYRKKRLMNFLLWVSSFIAMTLLLILFAKIGLQR